MLSHAIEASPQNPAARVVVANGSGQVSVRASDDGDGIPHDRAPELFEPFFTTKSEGVDLGLPCRAPLRVRMVDRLRIRRESDATVFELTLPTTAAAA